MEKPILVVGLGLLGLGISMQDINQYLQFVALIVPTLYASWRWYRDWKKTK